MPADDKPGTPKTRAHAVAAAVRSVAIFEGTKGLFVLLAGFGLLSLIHRDAQQVAEAVVQSVRGVLGVMVRRIFFLRIHEYL